METTISAASDKLPISSCSSQGHESDWSAKAMVGKLLYNPLVNQNNDQSQGNSERDVDPIIEAYKKDVDRTLIRENLRLTIDERFQQLMRLQKFAEELRRAGKQAESRS